MISKPALIAIFCSMPFLAAAKHGTCADADISATLMLQRQQRADAANLSIGQGISDTQAAAFDNRQRLQLQQLELQQHMQQQQLEQQQLRQNYQARELFNSQPMPIVDAQIQFETQRLSREREQQLRQFDWERQQLLQQFQWERQQQSQFRPLAPPQFTIH
jgi:hypothetical protein